MGANARFYKTPEQLQEIRDREKELLRLIFEAGGIKKYAIKIGLGYRYVDKAVHGMTHISDRLLGKNTKEK